MQGAGSAAEARAANGARPRGLVHPTPLVALAVLLLNDHALKGAGVLPGWLTGKLSDFAGLALFPVLLTTLVELHPRAPRRLVVALGSALATGLAFSLLKAWPAANALANAAWGAVALDPTDLVALPALLLALHHLLAPPVLPAPRAVQAAVVLASAAASIATSPAHTRRGFAVWQLDRQERPAGCARVTPFVAKSGKEGLGVGLRVASLERACAVSVSGVLRAGGRVFASEPEITVTAPGHGYLPFLFDDEALWNSGVRDGELELRVRSATGDATISLPLRYVHEGEHPWVRRDQGAAAPRAPSAKTLEVAR